MGSARDLVTFVYKVAPTSLEEFHTVISWDYFEGDKGGEDFRDMSPIFSKFPLGLKKLTLLNNNSKRFLVMLDIARFQKLVYFSIIIQSETFNQIVSSDSIEQLYYSNSCLESMDQINFPKNLQFWNFCLLNWFQFSSQNFLLHWNIFT